MFPDLPKENSIHIGKRNIDMAKKMLESLNIPIIAEDTGGHYGRSILLDTTCGKLRIKTAMLGEKFI
jgi:chemotaxis protein CheD